MGFLVTLPTTSTENIVLGDGGDIVGSWILHHVPPGANQATFILKTVARGSGVAATDAVPCLYYTTDSETALTATINTATSKIYKVPCDGQLLVIAATGVAGGGTIHATFVPGA